MDVMYYVLPGFGVLGVLLYIIKVSFPNFMDRKKDVDLEEAKATAKKGKAVTEKAVAEVGAKADELVASLEVLKEESIKDREATKAAMKDAKVDTKSWLEGEGFDVEEIFPED